MNRVHASTWLIVGALACSTLNAIRAEEPSTDAASDQPQATIELISINGSDEPTRGFFGPGGIDDFSGDPIRVNGTDYFTLNATEGTIASYGKCLNHNPLSKKDDRFDRYGHIEGLTMEIDRNTWMAKCRVNAQALLQLTGKARFEAYAHASFDAAASSKSQIDVTFVVADVPKSKIVKLLNSNVDALAYFDGLLRQDAGAFREGPQPRVVLGNIILLTGEFTSQFESSVDGKLHSVITDDGVELSVTNSRGETTHLLSPVVRCYRMYVIDFETDENGDIVRRERKNSDGRGLPVIFDLTPAL